MEGGSHGRVARPYINAAAHRAWTGRRSRSTAIVDRNFCFSLHSAPCRTLCCFILAVDATVYGLVLALLTAWELNPDDGDGSDRLPVYGGDASHGLG